MQELSSKVSLVLALVLQSALIKRGVKDPVPAFVLAGHAYMYLFFHIISPFLFQNGVTSLYANEIADEPDLFI